MRDIEYSLFSRTIANDFSRFAKTRLDEFETGFITANCFAKSIRGEYTYHKKRKITALFCGIGLGLLWIMGIFEEILDLKR